MLKITTACKPDTTELTLEGKLTGAWVSEFEECWRAVRADFPTRKVIVNLNAVTFIDAGGKLLLKRLYVDGVHLEAGDSLVRYDIERFSHL